MGHPVLDRQLRKLGLDREVPPSPEAWTALLDAVDRAYHHADQDRELRDRSIRLSSAEMVELHARLAREHDNLQAIFGALGEGVMVLDRDLRVASANPAALGILGLSAEQLIGQVLSADAPVEGFAAAVLAEPCSRALAGDHVRVDRVRVPVAEGLGDMSLAVSCDPLCEGAGHGTDVRGVVIAFRDVTVAVAAEQCLRESEALLRSMFAELQQAQKLEAVGRLAAGIAHEINTPIQFIGDNVSFLQAAFQSLWDVAAVGRQLGEAAASVAPLEPLADELRSALEAADIEFLEEEAPAALEQTLRGVARVAAIVRAMKSFGYQDATTPVVANLNEAVCNAITVAGSQLKGVGEVVTDLGDLPPVTCFLGDLNQVILNLLVNAADAIVDASRVEHGRIVVRTRYEDGVAEIAVSDNGIGIPQENQNRIYDLFFTTKDVGRGSGQGLALAHSVITKRHGGTLSFDTVPGEGTTFLIRLPVNLPAAVGG